MRQVPHDSKLKPRRYLIVGNGKVARHFCHYFSLMKIPYFHWYRGQAQSSIKLNKLIAKADVALILIKDNQIDSFIESHPALEAIPVCHFSGSLRSQFAHGCHPLMTFHEQYYSQELYQKIPFIHDSDFEFARFFPDLVNPHYPLRGELRPLYHALCVLAGNFSTLLWHKLFTDFETRLGLPREIAFPYLGQVAQNLVEQNNLPLTGPLARGDNHTIRQNLEALENDPYGQVYQAFVTCFHEVNTQRLSQLDANTQQIDGMGDRQFAPTIYPGMEGANA